MNTIIEQFESELSSDTDNIQSKSIRLLNAYTSGSRQSKKTFDDLLMTLCGWSFSALVRKTVNQIISQEAAQLMCLTCETSSETSQIRMTCGEHEQEHFMTKCLTCGTETEDEEPERWLADFRVFSREEADWIYRLREFLRCSFCASPDCDPESGNACDEALAGGFKTITADSQTSEVSSKFYGSFTVTVEGKTEAEMVDNLEFLYRFLDDHEEDLDIEGFADTEKRWSDSSDDNSPNMIECGNCERDFPTGTGTSGDLFCSDHCRQQKYGGDCPVSCIECCPEQTLKTELKTAEFSIMYERGETHRWQIEGFSDSELAGTKTEVYKPPLGADRLCSVFYHGDCISLTLGNRKVIISANGETRAKFEEDGTFYKNSQVADELISRGLKDADFTKLREAGFIEDENWFEIFPVLPDGTELEVLPDVGGDYREAVLSGFRCLQDDQFWSEALNECSSEEKADWCVPVVFRGQDNFIVKDSTKRKAAEIAEQKFRHGDQPDEFGNEWQEFERVGEITRI